MALTRSQITIPEIPRETVDFPELGGEVIVRGLLLRDRLALFATLRDDGGAYSHMATLLAMTVIGDDGKPLLTDAEWEAFGATHFDAALRLFAVVKRLAGLDSETVEKN